MSDETFLKAVGIKSEPIQADSEEALSDLLRSGAIIRFELCPQCSGRRHINEQTGVSHCVTCAARKKREERFAQDYEDRRRALADTQNQKYRQMNQHFIPPRSHANCPACELGLAGPHRNHMRYAPIPNSAQMENDDFNVLERKCRLCGFPCGPFEYCKPCARDKWGL